MVKQSRLSNNVIKRRFTLTDKVKKILEDRFPEWSFECEGGIHPHPIGALERAICEELLIREIKKDYGDVNITDIGGNANRHRAEKRKIHSCNPILCPEDVLRRRRNAYLEGANYCEHKSSTCDVPVDVYLSVHSLYYLTVSDILDHLDNATSGALFAVVHQFDNVYGGLHFNGVDYESKYEVGFIGDNPMVTMRVSGNLTPYRHDPLFWLQNSYAEDKGRAMAWNGYQVGDSWLLRFVKAPPGLTPSCTEDLPLIESVNRADHYGCIKGLRSLQDGEQLKPTLEAVSIANVTIHSLYKFVWLTHSGSNRKILLPKQIIQTVASKIVGQERTPKTLRNCIKLMQNCASPDKLSMPADMLVDCKTYGASLAFIYSLDKELDAFNKLCTFNMHGKYTALLSTLELRGLWDIRTYKFSKLVGLASCAGLWQVSSWKKNGMPSLSKLTSPKLMFGLALVTVGYGAYRWFNREYNHIPEVVSEYDVNRASVSSVSFDAASQWSEGLPGYESSNTTSELRPDATVSAIDVEEFDPKGEFYATSFTFSEYIPIVPASTIKNELISVTNRACMLVPTPMEKSWDMVYKFVCLKKMRSDPSIFIGEMDLVEYADAFDEWNSKFPKGRRKQHLQALESLELTPLENKDFYRSTFVKRELTLKGGTHPEEFDPRCIQGVSHRANVVLGPFMHCFSKMMHTAWSIKSKICYTSGYTAEELGGWRKQFGRTPVTIFEIDFTRFDAHQGKHCFKLEEWFYKTAGIGDWGEALRVFRAQSNTVGFTAHGVKYRVKYTRKSGDPNTSPGNSLINGTTANYIFDTVLKRQVPHEDPYGLDDTLYNAVWYEPISLDKGHNYKMLIQGDDVLVVVPTLYAAPRLDAIKRDIRKMYQALGFVVKLKTSNFWYDVEFCSSLFWPVDKGEYVLGPKIGRRLPKMGFSLKKLNPGQVKGLLLGANTEMAHIPILRIYVKQALKRLRKVKKSEYEDPDDKYKIKCASKHLMSDETTFFFTSRYSVSYLDYERTLNETLEEAKTLTEMVSWPDIHDLLDRDL